MKGAVKLRRTRQYRVGFEPSSDTGFMPVIKHPGVEPIDRKKAALKRQKEGTKSARKMVIEKI